MLQMLELGRRFHGSIKLFALYSHSSKLNLISSVALQIRVFFPSRSIPLVGFSLFDSEQNINGVNITNNYAV